MNRERGYHSSTRPQPVDRKVSLTQEVLFIKSGKVRVDYYNDEKIFRKSYSYFGKCSIVLKWWAWIYYDEESEIIEVKQGPYSGEQDKTRFESIADEKLNLK